MNYNGLLVVFGSVLLLVFTALIIRIFNKSKTVLGWFSFLLNQIGVILSFILFLDIQLLFMLGAILIVWGVAYFSLTWGEANLTPLWNFILIALSFVYFLLWLWWTGTKNFYHRFAFRKVKDQAKSENATEQEKSWLESIKLIMNTGMSYLIPLMIIIGLVMLGVTCFGAITAALFDDNTLTFFPANKNHGLSELNDFYLWHFLGLIPQIKVTETINWNAPFTYNNKGVGWLLLLFKAVMAYIVIARFYSWNKWRKELIE